LVALDEILATDMPAFFAAANKGAGNFAAALGGATGDVADISGLTCDV
jgi:hypothetical protein